MVDSHIHIMPSTLQSISHVLLNGTPLTENPPVILVNLVHAIQTIGQALQHMVLDCNTGSGCKEEDKRQKTHSTDFENVIDVGL